MFIDLTVKNVYPTSRWSSDQIESYKARKGDLLINLEKYLLDGTNVLDAKKIQESVFPQRDIDVFISHSHADEDEAARLALSMEDIGLTAFVDSCVWGHADELLQEIDNKFCIPDGWTNYSYNLRNRTTTNVHLILNAALQQMIARSELFIFLGSENAIKIDDYMSGEGRLSSPWIFSELTFAKSVKRSHRRVFSSSNESFEIMGSQRSASGAEFRFDLPKLKYEIDYEGFSAWLNDGESVRSNMAGRISGLTHLDKLYKKLGVALSQFSVPRWKSNNY
ncbi:toll/interleukin-1 receptor domain-containing protein [Pseudomonas sp. MF5691]|uniref:toll/interleukin-1 receptor domain-containing protein n=1 Tax=unclassified Pseudomonas TaxID=196821 RepID=UPI0018E7252B|nr:MULTISPECIES: toll/interleukin-1 receptor domain-containing protein [unclassified Pseudomonas]MBJ2290548.1 toll/interleukin-1 receptor domain-containing protein [Pseudomonas sp. MF5691]MDD2031620.1 toll/interleukin-1 receptor domain-containing protein [Pseudomonas sp. 39167]